MDNCSKPVTTSEALLIETCSLALHGLFIVFKDIGRIFCIGSNKDHKWTTAKLASSVRRSQDIAPLLLRHARQSARRSGTVPVCARSSSGKAKKVNSNGGGCWLDGSIFVFFFKKNYNLTKRINGLSASKDCENEEGVEGGGEVVQWATEVCWFLVPFF